MPFCVRSLFVASLSTLLLPLAAAASTHFTAIHSFSGAPDGVQPWGGVMLGPDGLVYGATYYGGTYLFDPVDNSAGNGTIFRFGPAGNYAVVYSFTNLNPDFSNTDGRWPQVPLVKDADGSLYGAAYYGGSNDDGTLFKFEPSSASFTTLHDFTGNNTDPNGVFPNSALTVGADGYLYGTTEYGGSAGNPQNGVVFRTARDGSGFQVLHSFGGNTGLDLPKGRLLAASDGFLYGIVTRYNGGAGGAIFRLRPDGSQFSVVHAFGGNDGGFYALAGFIPGLIEGSDGLLYGAAIDGGAHGNGTLYRLAKDGSGFTVLHTFNALSSSGTDTDGANPRTSLVFGSDGNLYGTAMAGGSHGNGAVFRLARDGSGFTVLHSFTATPRWRKYHNSDGAKPMGDIAFTPGGQLCGTTYTGGAASGGTAYCISF